MWLAVRNQGSWGCWSVFTAHDPAFPFSSYLFLPIFPLLKLLLKLLVKTNKTPFVLFWLLQVCYYNCWCVCDPLIMLLKYPMQIPSSSFTISCPEFSACFLQFLYSVLYPWLVGIKIPICPLHVKDMNFLIQKTYLIILHPHFSLARTWLSSVAP